MKIRCGNVCYCDKVVDTEISHVQVDGKFFCDTRCSEKYISMNDIFSFAAKGAPSYARRPQRERKWHEKDG